MGDPSLPYYSVGNSRDLMGQRIYMGTPGEVDARLMEKVGEVPGFKNIANPVEAMGMWKSPKSQLQVPRKHGGLVQMKECNCAK